ncbi:MAG: putative hydro-lyase [Streptosporangiales bacterium]|nr:putative hydro-lyase [Streptosporangiales bacterium]
MTVTAGARLSPEQVRTLEPAGLREAFRAGRWTEPTGGMAPGRLQANLVILPRDEALEFLIFCQRNPKPCPLVGVTEPGVLEAPDAPGSDLRTDLPRYRVFTDGVVRDEPTDITAWWRPDLVGMLLGCSVTFEDALVSAGVPVRHLEAGQTCPMYVTSRRCVPVGRFHGPLVVTMRSIPAALVPLAVEVTARLPEAHGAPVQVGDPAQLGIDLDRPDFGDPPIVRPGDVPVFWACGVTPQLVCERSRPSLMVTHYPGCMFITDRRADT